MPPKKKEKYISQKTQEQLLREFYANLDEEPFKLGTSGFAGEGDVDVDYLLQVSDDNESEEEEDVNRDDGAETDEELVEEIPRQQKFMSSE